MAPGSGTTDEPVGPLEAVAWLAVVRHLRRGPLGPPGRERTVSVKVMAWVWDRSKAEGTALLVLLAIADSAGHDGRDAWPSLATLASRCRVSVRTVQRAVDELVAAGELEVEQHGGGTRHTRPDRRPNRYTVRMATGGQNDQAYPDGVTSDAPRGDIRPAETPERGDTAMSTYPSFERPEPSAPGSALKGAPVVERSAEQNAAAAARARQLRDELAAVLHPEQETA